VAFSYVSSLLPKGKKGKGKKSRKERKAEAEFKVDTEDPRFTALYTRPHDFNIDPTLPLLSKKASTMEIVKVRQQKLQDEQKKTERKEGKPEGEQEVTGGSALKNLVESVKRKASAMSGKTAAAKTVLPTAQDLKSKRQKH
jgi:hypothetical protein